MTEQPKRKPKAQDVVAIVRMVCEQRARQRRIPLRRREITVKKMKDNFRINKFEIFIDWNYAIAGNPVKMIDRVLDAVEDFDKRVFEERVRQLNIVKSEIMRLSSYLERTMSANAYEDFIASLLPPEPVVVPIELLAPDEVIDFNMEHTERWLVNWLLSAEGEHFQDREIYFDA